MTEWDSIKVECYTIEGLPDPTDVSQNQQTSVGKPTIIIAKLSPTTPKQAKVKCLINTKQLIDKSCWSMLLDLHKTL